MSEPELYLSPTLGYHERRNLGPSFREPKAIKHFFFHTWSRSENSLTRFACRQEFCFSACLHPFQFIQLIFSIPFKQERRTTCVMSSDSDL